MKHPILEKLEFSLKSLECLFTYQLPSDSLNSNPLDFYAHKLDPVFICIENIVQKTKDEIQTKKEINDGFRQKIKERSARVGIEFDNLVFENLALECEYLSKFDEKVFLAENRIKMEIDDMVIEINSIKEILGETEFCIKNEASIEQYEIVFKIYEIYCEKKKELEKKRVVCVKNILNAYKILERINLDSDDVMIQNDHSLVKIDVLHRKSKFYAEEIERRKCLVSGLIIQIENLRDVLYFYNTIDEEKIIDSITDKNIDMLLNMRDKLVEMEIRYFETIFNETKSKLYEICSVFGMDTVDFEKTKENLDIMKKIIHELSIKKDKFLEIQEIINKRSELKSRMIEFEKSASDPKRLFRSSFQLLDEERFRKTAYPNLLKIEGQILECIEEFEDNFGEFKYKGEVYKDFLSHEIANRIINKNVFIMNKSNTPKKCKRQ